MDYFEQRLFNENEQIKKKLFTSPLLSKYEYTFSFLQKLTFIQIFSFIKVSSYQEENQQRQLLSYQKSIYKIQPLFITYGWLVAAKNSWGDSDSHILFLGAKSTISRGGWEEYILQEISMGDDKEGFLMFGCAGLTYFTPSSGFGYYHLPSCLDENLGFILTTYLSHSPNSH